MSPSRFTAKKINKNIGGRKIHQYGKSKAPTNFCQLHLSLIYLQQIKSEISSDGMHVFSPQFFVLHLFIYICI
jgi:hypothetical protein